MKFPDFENKSVLITGGAGLIGTHLTKALLKENVKEIIIYYICKRSACIFNIINNSFMIRKNNIWFIMYS